MQYIALLRGVNISGKNKVTMSIFGRVRKNRFRRSKNLLKQWKHYFYFHLRKKYFK